MQGLWEELFAIDVHRLCILEGIIHITIDVVDVAEFKNKFNGILDFVELNVQNDHS